MEKFNHNNMPKANIVYPGHNAELVENLWKCFVNGESLDLVFICDKNIKVYANKLVFATVSPFLSKIINVSGQDVVYISVPDIDHKRLRMLITLLYEGVARVTYEEMIILRELMIHLDIELKNSEIKPVNPMESFTPVIEETDPLSIEHPLQAQPPYVVPKVESNTDCFSNKADNTDLVNMDMSAKDTMNTDLLNKGTEDMNISCRPYLQNEKCAQDNMMDNGNMDIINLDNGKNENEVIDLSSDEDDNYNDNCDNTKLTADCESVKETELCTGQVLSLRTRVPEKSAKISEEQREILEAQYRTEKYLTLQTLMKLNRELHLPSFLIKNWFLNRQKKDMPGSTVNESQSGKNAAQMNSGPVYPYRSLTCKEMIYLEKIYSVVQFPDNEVLSELGQILKISQKSLRDWFRQKLKTTENVNMELMHGRSIEEKAMYNDEGKQRRNRITFSEQQKHKLENYYQGKQYPHNFEISDLANTLGLPTKSVHIWFQNRRAKDKVFKRKKSCQHEPRRSTVEESSEDTQDSRDLYNGSNSSDTYSTLLMSVDEETTLNHEGNDTENRPEVEENMTYAFKPVAADTYNTLIMTVDEDEDTEEVAIQNFQGDTNNFLSAEKIRTDTNIKPVAGDPVIDASIVS